MRKYLASKLSEVETITSNLKGECRRAALDIKDTSMNPTKMESEADSKAIKKEPHDLEFQQERDAISNWVDAKAYDSQDISIKWHKEEQQPEEAHSDDNEYAGN